MNNISLLVTRPNHDLSTNGLYYWAGLIIKNAKDRNIPVYDLEEEKTLLPFLWSNMKAQVIIE